MNPRNEISVVAVLSVLLTVASAMCCGAWKAAALALIFGIWAIQLHRTGQADLTSAMMGCFSVVVASLLLLLNLFCSVAMFPLGQGVADVLVDKKPPVTRPAPEPRPPRSKTTVVRVESDPATRVVRVRDADRIIVQQSQSVHITTAE